MRLLLAAFLGMNGSEEELENHPTLVEVVSAFGLGTTNDPIAAFFGFWKSVDAANEVFGKCVAENDFDAGRR